MNERTVELYTQALDSTYTKIGKEHAGKGFFEAAVAGMFAELIIGHATECVRDVLRDENSDLSYEAASQVQKRIKEYFGVEE